MLGVIGSTLWVARQQKVDGLVINVAGRHAVLTQKLTKAGLGYTIELREQDEARKLADMLSATRSHLADSIAAAEKSGAFKLTPEMMNFVPVAATLKIGAEFSKGRPTQVRHISSNFVNPANKPMPTRLPSSRGWRKTRPAAQPRLGRESRRWRQGHHALPAADVREQVVSDLPRPA